MTGTCRRRFLAVVPTRDVRTTSAASRATGILGLILVVAGSGCSGKPQAKPAADAGDDPPATGATGTVPAPAPEPVPVPAEETPPPADRRRTDPLFRPHTYWEYQARPGMSAAERVATAERLRGAVVRNMFQDAHVAFPPAHLLFRVFKEERDLEVWAASRPEDPLKHLATYEICYASGVAGPKNREHDRQVPEGFYQIASLNPASAYHLSLRVNYPNAWDARRSRASRLGGDIMIHGNCVSIGCMAMSDERIEEIWVMAQATRRNGGVMDVHIYPGRDLDRFIGSVQDRDPHLASFWRSLKAGNDLFEKTRRVPRPGNRDGEYVF